MDKYIIDNKSKAFALKIIKLCAQLNDDKYGYLLLKQLLRCGTSIGANVRERLNAQSKADFISKLQIALKEADETAYWLEVLFKIDAMDEHIYDHLLEKNGVIRRKLIASVTTAKGET